VIGDDCVDDWEQYLDVMVSSIADNGGRSCINASAIVVPKYAAEIADALAQKLGPIAPTRNDDPEARLSGFANLKMADFIDAQIEDGLQTPGATDATPLTVRLIRMSPAVIPSSRVTKLLWATAARAEPPSIQPRTTYQRPHSSRSRMITYAP